jgi:meiosis-specific protein HOP1
MSGLTGFLSIIEAYTFNFEVYFSVIFLCLPLTILSQYRRIAGTNLVVPIMSLGEDLEKLSLGDGGHSKDPILLASAEGRLPTFKDVKKSLKVRSSCIHELATNHLSRH